MEPFIAPDFACMTAEQMNAWYEQHVGYRPQTDSPGMTEQQLREICISYAQARSEAERS